MKVFCSVASLDPSAGGPARSVPQLSLALADRGHEVGIWASEMPRERKKDKGDRGVLAPILADLNVEKAGRIRVLEGSFEEALDVFGQPQLVHDHGIWLPCHREVVKVCRGRDIPRVVSPRGMLMPWSLNNKKWKKRLAWWLYQRQDLRSVAGLHATADSEAAQLRKLGLRAPIVVAANGVVVAEESKARAETVREGPHKALFLSRVHRKKGLPLLVEAWAKVKPENWQMRVVGPQEEGHLAEVREMVEKAGLADSWSFGSGLEGEQKWQAMKEADLFILPSHSENFGIVVAEALAVMTPVITTTGAPWEGLLDHQCGWWVAPAVDPIAEALKSAIHLSDQERSEMGGRGRDWVKKDFAWPGIAQKMEEFYREVVG